MLDRTLFGVIINADCKQLHRCFMAVSFYIFTQKSRVGFQKNTKKFRYCIKIKGSTKLAKCSIEDELLLICFYGIIMLLSLLEKK